MKRELFIWVYEFKTTILDILMQLNDFFIIIKSHYNEKSLNIYT